VDGGHRLLLGRTPQDVAQRRVARVLAQRAPVAAHDVEPLLLDDLDARAIGPGFDLDGRILFLLEQQHAAVDAVHLDL
jgi:hypothetical protein